MSRESSIQFTQFKTSFDRANVFALDVANGRGHITDKEVQAAYTQMAIDGFSLVDANCADFFRGEGNGQKWALFVRDLVAAGGTLATAIAAAADAPRGVTTGFSISTATAYNGLDIYQRNFLFGADNIDSVRTLVGKALATHTIATVQAAQKTPWISFGSAANSIMEHQAICSPAAIFY